MASLRVAANLRQEEGLWKCGVGRAGVGRCGLGAGQVGVGWVECRVRVSCVGEGPWEVPRMLRGCVDKGHYPPKIGIRKAHPWIVVENVRLT